MLKHILDNFDAAHYRHACVSMAALIKAARPSSCSIVDAFAALGRASSFTQADLGTLLCLFLLFCPLGQQLISCKPVEEQRLPLLNEVWKYVGRSPTGTLSELTSFIRCAAHWINVVQQHYGEKELSVLLSSLSQKLQGYVVAGTELDNSIFQLLEAILSSLIEKFNTFGIMVILSTIEAAVLDITLSNSLLCGYRL